MKVLIANILKDQTLIDAFDRKMDYVSTKLKFSKVTVYIKDLNRVSQLIDYSHLIISGSEASAIEWEPWYSELENVIDRFSENRKPVLGICFGHQFLACKFCGETAVKRADQPEFGWIDIVTMDDELFKDVQDFKSFALHYDEVDHLDERFNIIAHSRQCRIHAFKMIGRPIWGVQFHPDFLYEDTKWILKRIKAKDPNFDKNYVTTPIDEEIYEKNMKIFENFLNC